jgi:hypothetical protein
LDATIKQWNMRAARAVIHHHRYVNEMFALCLNPPTSIVNRRLTGGCCCCF